MRYDFFMSMTLGKKFFITIIAAVLAAAALAALYGWLYSHIRKEKERLSGFEYDISLSEKGRAAARSLSVLFSEHEADIRRIENFFVDPNQPVDFIESLERLARQTGNHAVLSIESAPKDQHMFSFRLSAEGAEEKLIKYVRMLELLPYEIHMDEISLQRSLGQETGSGGAKESSVAPTHRLTLLIRVKTK